MRYNTGGLTSTKLSKGVNTTFCLAYDAPALSVAA